MKNKTSLIKNPDLIKDLTEEEIIDILKKSKAKFKKQKKLIELKGFKNIIFIGDTHGDFVAVKKVVKKYLKKENALVFLGDYVDRGKQSKETINFLLFLANNYDNIFLLMGNHEAYPMMPCYPNEFWKEIKDSELYNHYADVFAELPLAVSAGDIIALHAGLPDIKIGDINKIKIKKNDKNLNSIVWDDFVDEPGEYIRTDQETGRKKYGKDHFDKVMKRFNKKILVRGHSSAIKGVIFDDKCLTLITSKDYLDKGLIEGRIIAVVDLNKKIESVKDLKIEKI